MSQRYKGGVISATPPTVSPNTPTPFGTATGVWTMQQQFQYEGAGTWPSPFNYDVTDVFSTYLYTGNNTAQTVTTGVNLSGLGGLLWIKNRSTSISHVLFDTVRGNNNWVKSNSTDAASTLAGFNQTFTTTGFTLNNSYSETNSTSNYYTSWSFVEAKSFFDIVTYTGNGANQTINHNLGSAPGCIFIKCTSASGDDWLVYHRSIGATAGLRLNTTGAADTIANFFNNTAPTSTQFTVGSSANGNASGATYVAYLFAHDAGGFGPTGSDSIISCGSFTAAGAAQTINLGWEAQWVMMKRYNAIGSWWLFDTTRSMGVITDSYLQPNSTAAELIDAAAWISPSPVGFIAQSGVSAGDYIYIAIRRGPLKPPTDATKVFVPTVYTGTNVDNRLVNTTIAPDLIWARQRNSTTGAGMVVGDRLRGNAYLRTGNTAVENTDADSLMTPTLGYGNSFSAMNGFGVGNDATSQLNASTVANNQVVEAFKRAPSFLDIVCYTGTGANTTIPHNLGAVPEMFIVKKRSGTGAWCVNSAYINADARLELQSAEAVKAPPSFSDMWNNTRPTSSVFTVSSDSDVNQSSVSYVAYLFATCPGVSKVGSYIGTGTTQQINCGFTNGSRLVLIKRTDSTGDWYIWDSARGIVAGNDPYLGLNVTGAEVTSTDYVDTYSAGFELSSTAPAALNEAPGVTWVSRTSAFGTDNIFCAAYGNGLYLAGGVSGELATSPDGISWTNRATGFGVQDILGIAYGNGLYVAVATNGALRTSPDGITWTSRTSGFSADDINDVAYGNGLFVAVGQSGKLRTSTDGITWTARTANVGSNVIFGVTYGNGIFIIVGESRACATSTDGITWTAQSITTGTTYYDVAYGSGLFVTVGASGRILTSADNGVTWTTRTNPAGTDDLYGVTYGNGIFVAVGNAGDLVTSSDGITWTSRTSGFSTTNIRDVAFENGLFVAVGLSGTMTTNKPEYVFLAIA